MSVSNQISRIQTDRDTIRTKLVTLGLAIDSANLDELALAISKMAYHTSIAAEVKEGESYTIPKGYHNGSGIVKAVAGGGNYQLQAKTIIPTKEQQAVTSDEGYYGLSTVTVEPIPKEFQNVSSVTATADDVLTGKVYVDAAGKVITGTMVNNGSVKASLNTKVITYTIPKGYHNGTGTISITLEDKTVTPTKSKQVITPTTTKVLNSVIVNPIPAEYITTTDATATAGQILDTETAYVNGVKITGTMPNNGTQTAKLDATSKTYQIPAGYHDGKGTISITTETKIATPTEASQTIAPTEGSLLTQVTVEPIPSKYKDVSGVTATETDVLADKKFVAADGTVVTGTIPNNGAFSGELDAMAEAPTVAVPSGYTAGGSVTLAPNLEKALAAI